MTWNIIELVSAEGNSDREGEGTLEAQINSQNRPAIGSCYYPNTLILLRVLYPLTRVVSTLTTLETKLIWMHLASILL